MRRQPRPPQGRILAVGLLISFVLHVIVLLVVQYVMTSVRPELPAAVAADPEPARPEGLRVLTLRESATAADPPVERVAPVPVPVTPRPPAPTPPDEPDRGPPEEAAPDAPLPRGPGAVERLRPWPGDPRLFERRIGPGLPRRPEDVALERIYGRLEMLNDSILAELESQRRALDWTFRTADGKRWGISPEGIHLGDITLPAPSLGAPAGRREEHDRRMQEWSDIQRQADMARVRDAFQERVRAIRERRERERREREGSNPN